MVSMQNTPVGITTMRLVCGALGIKPITASRAQVIANKVGEKTIAINEKDMTKWADEAREIHADRGVDLQHLNKIDVAMDARYDNVGMKSSVTPGTAATAATGIACETNTPQSKVISMAYISKRCSAGTIYERETGRNANCGTKECHKNCAAKIPKNSSITERAMSKIMAGELYDNNGLEIATATTELQRRMGTILYRNQTGQFSR